MASATTGNIAWPLDTLDAARLAADHQQVFSGTLPRKKFDEFITVGGSELARVGERHGSQRPCRAGTRQPVEVDAGIVAVTALDIPAPPMARTTDLLAVLVLLEDVLETIVRLGAARHAARKEIIVLVVFTSLGIRLRQFESAFGEDFVKLLIG